MDFAKLEVEVTHPIREEQAERDPYYAPKRTTTHFHDTALQIRYSAHQALQTHVLVDDVSGSEGRQNAGQGGHTVGQTHQCAGEVGSQVHVVDIVPCNAEMGAVR